MRLGVLKELRPKLVATFSEKPGSCEGKKNFYLLSGLICYMNTLKILSSSAYLFYWNHLGCKMIEIRLISRVLSIWKLSVSKSIIAYYYIILYHITSYLFASVCSVLFCFALLCFSLFFFALFCFVLLFFALLEFNSLPLLSCFYFLFLWQLFKFILKEDLLNICFIFAY